MNFDYVRNETLNRHALACRSNDVDLLQTLTEESPEGVSNKDNRGWTPLHEAAHSGAANCIRYLGSLSGIDLNARTWEGETPLFLACKNLPESKPAIHALLKLRARVNLATNEDCTPLQYAAVKGDYEVVCWLVRKGATVNKSNVWLETPLHCAVKRSTVEEDSRLNIVKYLIKHEAKVNASDENQLTPLMLAAQKGLDSVCRVLLDNDPTIINMKAEDGATALMLACQCGEKDVVDLLLEAGAEVDHHADDGTMAVHLASISKKNCVDVLKRILPKTDTNKVYALNRPACFCKSITRSKEAECLSPFHLAIDWENYEGIELLSEYLDPSRFLVPIDECPVHSEFCYEFQKGECKLFRYRRKNPLSHLLSGANLPSSEQLPRLLKVLQGNITDPQSMPPILSLVIGSRRVDGNIFQEDDIHRTILRSLIECGAVLDKDDLFPVVLLSHVSGVYALIQEGLVNPRDLVDPQLLEHVRHLVNQGFSRRLLNTQFSVPLLSPRLLAVAHLVSETGMLSHSYLRSLHDILWFQLTELHIPKVEILNELYAKLKCPRSLQSLCRAEIYWQISGRPRESTGKLPLPPPIRGYLMFPDLDVEKIVAAYKRTWEKIHHTLTGV